MAATDGLEGRNGTIRNMMDGSAGAARSMVRGTILTLALTLLATTGVAAATGAPAPQRASAAEPVRQVEDGAGESAGDGSTCTKARKRLWVEGEGWIVRRITSCH